jgi:hypothetical protein
MAWSGDTEIKTTAPGSLEIQILEGGIQQWLAELE